MGRLLVATLLASFLALGCHKTKQYETEITIERVAPVRFDENQRPLTTDLEVKYVKCPGEQREVIRGGADFSACIGKLPVGHKAKVRIEQRWTADDVYDSFIVAVDGCERPPDPLDEASYKLVRDCRDWNVNGARVGFQCNYLGRKELIKACPWFSKH